MRHRTLIAGLSTVVSFFILGCSGSESTSEETFEKTTAIEVTSENTVLDETGTVALADKNTMSKVATKNQPAFMKEMPGLGDPDKIEWNNETARNAPIPDELPVYTNSTPLDGSSDRRFFVFQWESTDTREDIHQFYRQELNQTGWDVEDRRSVGLVKASKGKRELDVWIGGKPNEPVSILVRYKKS